MTDLEIVTFIVKRFERGFVNDPDDNGKATKDGVTQAALGRARRLGRDATVDEVRALPTDEAITILLQDYVYACRFDRIASWPLRFAVIDYAINSGTAHAGRVLQRILGLQPDGAIGPVSLARINGLSVDARRVVGAQYVGDRIRLVGRLVTRNPARRQYRFGEGWCNRVATVRETIAA